MVVGIILGVVLFLTVVGLALWLTLGSGARTRRAYNQARRLIHDGDWRGAWGILRVLDADDTLSEAWRDRVRKAMGECHQTAAEQSLREKNYEEALARALEAGPYLGINEHEQRGRVIDTMLAEVRRLFALAENNVEVDAVVGLLTRTFALQAICPEASFWLALCLIRQGRQDAAIAHLQTAHEQAGKQFLDPAYYLGMIHHRQDKYQEAVRFFSEANRVDSSCPFVTMHLGVSLVESGGDSGLALRAIQRAVGQRGLSMWLATPDRVWIEAFPETRSYIRRLAQRHRFVCPILGADLNAIIRFGMQAQAKAHYNLCQFQESANLYGKLLQDCPPTASLLRGLGLALTRMERYDQAYKHLRAAVEMEQGKDPITAGYLALCGAMGKPTQVQDKEKNVAWAIKLLSRYQVVANPEWANIWSAVFAEARTLGMSLSKDDQLQLCNVLASVHAHTPEAAQAYACLTANHPQAVLPRHAWLYCQAAAVHGCSSEHDLDLFARTFREPTGAQQYFARQEWNFKEVEYTFLERCASRQPGRFPDVLGPDYPPRGESFLLERASQLEQAGDDEKARHAVEVLLRLAPRCVQAFDRLARLYYRQGHLDKAVQLLADWRKLEPTNTWPVIRQAILEQERGNAQKRAEALSEALGLTRSSPQPSRAGQPSLHVADVAYLGARLVLRDALKRDKLLADPGQRSSLFAEPIHLLEESLREDPAHCDALACLAAVHCYLGNQDALARLAPRFQPPGQAANAPGANQTRNPGTRYQFLGAVASLAARDFPGAVHRAQFAYRACKESPSPEDAVLAQECCYIVGWACLHGNNLEAAAKAFQQASQDDQSPSAPLARALLGRVHFLRGDYDGAVTAWTALAPEHRLAWSIDQPLPDVVFLAGLDSYEKGQYEQAADRFQQAGKLGLRDKQLGSLITLALVRAGQRLLYQNREP
jgi:tetratricopeptide (TPR) repeat protein